MITEPSTRYSLPPLKKTQRKSTSPGIVKKIQKIHEIRENDWKLLEKKISSRHQTIKINGENSFMRDMWAFKSMSRSCVENIQDTSGFKLRKEVALRNMYKRRLEHLFTSANTSIIKS